MTKQGGFIHLREFCQICMTFSLQGNLAIIAKIARSRGPPSAKADNRSKNLSNLISKGPPREGGSFVDCSDSGFVLGFGACFESGRRVFQGPETSRSRKENEQLRYVGRLCKISQ